jgi:hypothetical protein
VTTRFRAHMKIIIRGIVENCNIEAASVMVKTPLSRHPGQNFWISLSAGSVSVPFFAITAGRLAQSKPAERNHSVAFLTSHLGDRPWQQAPSLAQRA